MSRRRLFLMTPEAVVVQAAAALQKAAVVQVIRAAPR